MSLFPASKRVAEFLGAKISVENQTFWTFIWFLNKDRMSYCDSIKQATSVINGSYNNFSRVETMFYIKGAGKMNEFCHFIILKLILNQTILVQANL